MSTQNANEPAFDALDRAVAAVRDETLDPATVEAARERVRQRLGWVESDQPHEHRISGCDGFQSLIPSWLEGDLSPERAALLEDHTRECLSCRRALHEARGNLRSDSRKTHEPTARTAGSTATPGNGQRWLAAAAAVLAVLTAGFALFQVLRPAPVMASVEQVDGTLLAFSDTGEGDLAGGAEIREGQAVRTGHGSGALVRLEDGSLIEMSERAELSLHHGWRGTTIRLDRGQIIVQAAKQRSGALYVATDRCKVAVKGTIFSVNHGVKGSRVSVIEGQVQVQRRGETDLLNPGQQITTDSSLAQVPVEREIAWSRHRERYANLLRELTALGDEISRRVTQPDRRFESHLLDLAPASTMGFIALPNLGSTFGDAYAVLQERMAESPALEEWWQSVVGESGHQEDIDALVSKLRDLGGFLGEEIAIAVPGNEEHGASAPVLMADVGDESGLLDFIAQEAQRLEQLGGHPVLQVVADPASASDLPEGLYLWVGHGTLVASPDLAALARTVAAADGSAPSGFVGTSFHQRLAQAYQDGVEWLLGVNLEDVLTTVGDDAQIAGIQNLQHIVVEHQEVGEGSQSSALITFNGPRQGVASWMAEPAPMGALDFISPDAYLAAAFLARDPEEILAELFAQVGDSDEDFAAHRAEAEAQLGLDLLEDIAAPLGGEVAFAIDGPVLPKPSWKLIMEVNDPGRLAQSLEVILAKINASADETGEAKVSLTSETVGDRIFFTLQRGEALAIHYVLADTYVIAAPSRALLERALQYQESRNNLVSSSRFQELLPENGEAHLSALLYQNLSASLEGLDLATAAPDGSTPGEEVGLSTLLEVARHLPPSLVSVYGHQDSIVVARRGSGKGILGFDLAPVMGALMAHGEELTK